VVDLAYFYPENLKPSISRWAFETLATSYKDQFFIREIPFFSFFRLLEVLHIPVCLWGIKAVLTSMSSLFCPANKFLSPHLGIWGQD
jgi:hypothetical protein